MGSAQTLPGVATSQNFWQVDVGLRPGTSPAAYMSAVNGAPGGPRSSRHGPARRVK